MTPPSAAATYLTIPKHYAASLGGLQWTPGGDAIVDTEGNTVAVFEEIVNLLDGVFVSPPVPPFVAVLQLLRAMKQKRPEMSGTLSTAYSRASGSPGLTRNAGLLIAVLCKGTAGRRRTPSWDELKRELYRRRHRGFFTIPTDADEPPFAPHELAYDVGLSLEAFDEASLVHRLKFGTGPSDAGEPVAEAAKTLPERIREVLDTATTRPRIAGAAALVPSFDAAITVPARKRHDESVPQGGYADVTTRGDPDRLLPSQFALDPDDFIRRFAEHELLYFRREDPHDTPAPDRVVVLDRGVRTWGVVRHALTAAALSLLKSGPTGPDRTRLIASAATDDLTATLEASDLSADPGAIAQTAFTAPGDGPRDLFVLTHPRALREPAVIDAFRAARPEDRPFALTVNDQGEVELIEWTAYGPKSLRTFRVDLDAAEAAVARAERGKPQPERTYRDAWTGDIEPVVFPFRPGTIGNVTHLGFDADARWLVYTDAQGAVHALDLTSKDTTPEILPRAFRDGVVFQKYTKLLPVRDGFAIAGTIDLPDQLSTFKTVTIRGKSDPVMTSTATEPARDKVADRYCVAHYDLRARTVRLYDLGKWDQPAEFRSYPEHHAVTCVHYGYAEDERAVRPNLTVSSAIDLASGTWTYSVGSQDGPGRRALTRALEEFLKSDSLTMHVGSDVPKSSLSARILFHEGKLTVVEASRKWRPFSLTENGKSLTDQTLTFHSVLIRDILCLTYRVERSQRLTLVQGPDSVVIRTITDLADRGTGQLSSNGHRLAYVSTNNSIRVLDTDGRGIVTTVPHAKLHTNLSIDRFQATPFHLATRIGNFVTILRYQGPLLVAEQGLTNANQSSKMSLPPPLFTHDEKRFPQSSMRRNGQLKAVLDRFGQVIVTNIEGTPILYVLVRRTKAAAWMPDGTRWGDAALLGGPPTPHADARIAEAIRTAGGGTE